MAVNDVNLNVRINREVKAAAEEIIRHSDYLPSQVTKYYLYRISCTKRVPKIGKITKPMDATLNTRVSREIRDSAKKICEENGTSLSEVCRHLYEQIYKTGAMPNG